jgi:hypothetical protein
MQRVYTLDLSSNCRLDRLVVPVYNQVISPWVHPTPHDLRIRLRSTRWRFVELTTYTSPPEENGVETVHLQEPNLGG